jgi:uracil-DNA glycosylase
MTDFVSNCDLAGSELTSSDPAAANLVALLDAIRACRLCRDAVPANPLPHEPRPVVRVSREARLLVAGQAPGMRVQLTGIPFNDPSGDRLRGWMNVPRDVFYDEKRIAIIPMGFCFPGYSKTKSDLPPRRECRATWHDELFALLPNITTILAIGTYAQDYHFARLGRPLPKAMKRDGLIAGWRDYADMRPRIIALPHPSWRNSGWLKRNPWFETDVLPMLQAEVSRAIG